MAVDAPSYAEIRDGVIADITQDVVISVGGAIVQPDFTVGSVFGTFAEVLAFTLDAFYGQLQRVDAGLRLATAAGDDLGSLVALLDVQRVAATAAMVPVKFGRLSVDSSLVTIPAGKRVLAQDAQGNPTIAFLTRQDPTQAVGVAGIIAGGASAGWALADAEEAGLGGNVAAGQVTLLGDAIAGVDTAGNPQVPTPSAPTVANVGTTGATTYQYRIVAHGITGRTLPSATGQTTTGHATLTGSHYNALTWPEATDAASYDVLRLVSGSWRLLRTVTTASYDDTGADTPVAYSVPLSNTTNAATGGSNAESDEALRARAPLALQVAARSTLVALREAVLGVSGVQRVFIRDAGVGGQAAGTITLSYVGALNPVSGSTAAAIATTVAATKAAGIQVTTTQITPLPVAVAYTYAAQSTVSSPAGLVAPINAAVTAYLQTLSPGDPVRYSRVLGAIVGVSGVAACTTLAMTPQGGSTSTNADVPGVSGTLFAAGSFTATVGS